MNERTVAVKGAILKSKTIAVLATIMFMMNTVPSYASDFFPLDVWQEMANWQPNNAAVNQTDIGVYGQPRSRAWDKSKMIHTSFPFDVMDALTDLDGKDRQHINGRFTSIDNSHGHQMNPYWLPAEYGAGQVDQASVK